MKFLSNIFDQFKTNNISGLTDELKTLYINYLSNKSNNNIVVLTSSLFEFGVIIFIYILYVI